MAEIKALAGPGPGQPEAEYRLRQACRDLEAVFMRHLVSGLRATVPEGGLVGESAGSELYREMADEVLAGSLADAGGVGLADLLYHQLHDRVVEETEKGADSR
jgi:flagellar protein FlgJ